MAPTGNAFGRLFDQPPTLEGTGVRMEPFAERHREGLWTALGDPAVWRWVKIDASAGREVFDAWFDEAVGATAARTEFGFVTVACEDDRPVGSSRFLALRPAGTGDGRLTSVDDRACRRHRRPPVSACGISASAAA